MTGSELESRCKNRYFDRIIVVTDDIFSKMANMQRVQKEIPGKVCECTGTVTGDDGIQIEYTEKRAIYYFSNTEICYVEPVCGETVYKKFLDKNGEGICCIREKVSSKTAGSTKQSFADKGFKPAQACVSDDSQSYWFDLEKEIGIIFELYTSDAPSEEVPYRSSARIAQINISTPALQDTITFITDLLEIGPWEVGRQCTAVAHDTAFTVDGELKDQDFAFLLAILVCGNIEWEVIEPEIGQLVYSEFIDRRRIGFHHVLMEIPEDQWTDRLDTYEEDGIAMNCKGSLGPVQWCYMNTEKELGFYMELRTDAVMDKLPDGYVQYYYPED